MSDRDRKTPEEIVGANIKAMRAKLGFTQVELAEAMRGLGHSWIQTTVAKTEAADRPLRLNEVADLARILGTGLQHLASADIGWELDALRVTLDASLTHVHRLKSEAEELDRQLTAKRRTLEEAQKHSRELQAELDQVNGEH